MNVNNKISGKVQAEKFEPETTIKKNIHDIKADRVKNIDSLDIKISAIEWNNIYLSSEPLSTNSNSWPTYKTRR